MPDRLPGGASAAEPGMALMLDLSDGAPVPAAEDWTPQVCHAGVELAFTAAGAGPLWRLRDPMRSSDVWYFESEAAAHGALAQRLQAVGAGPLDALRR